MGDLLKICMSNKISVEGKLYVAECDFGKGMFASENIHKGERILTFTGTFINLEEALAKGDLSGNTLQIDDYTYIDLEPPAVLINHSCDPNAGLVSGNVLIALRDIDKHEQIFYDYSTTMSEGDLWRMECRCGASNCRGTVMDFDFLPASLQEKYLELGIVQNFIVRQYKKTASCSASKIKDKLLVKK